MNAIFWLVFLFILARSIWRLIERAGANGKFEGPLGRPAPTGTGRPMPGSEERPKLKIPEYLTRRSEEQPAELSTKRSAEQDTVREHSGTVVLAGEIAEPSVKGQPSGLCPEGPLAGTAVKIPCGMEGNKEDPARKRHERRNQGDPFSDMLCPDQVVKGIAWSMILGPRGGLRAKR